MKQICICILLIVFYGNYTCRAQNSIAYQYDEAGNRTLRKVVVLNGPQSIKQHPKADSTVVIDKINNRDLKIYPNPTMGRLIIDLSTFQENEEIQLTLFTAKGEILQNKNTWPGITELDLSSLARGWYVLQINTLNFKREYKIMKE